MRQAATLDCVGSNPTHPSILTIRILINKNNKEHKMNFKFFGALRLLLNFLTGVFVIAGGIILPSTPITIAGCLLLAGWLAAFIERYDSHYKGC